MNRNRRPPREKKVRMFNRATHAKGKIKLDDETWVDYDYSREYPVVKLNQEKRKINHKEFIMDKFPKFRFVSDRDLTLNHMDFYIIPDSDHAYLTKDKQKELVDISTIE